LLPADELRIDTPEQIALEIPIAGIGSRFLAIAVDTLLQFVGSIVATFLFLFTGPLIGTALFRLPAGLVAFLPAIAMLVVFCIYWGYFAFFEILWKGQTPGKRVAGIRVIKDSGRPIDISSAILRNLLRAVDFLPALYTAGIICMILNRHSRRLGDLVAGTVVVHDRPPARIDAEWAAPPDPALVSVINLPAVRLTDGELVLIETYLQRRLEVDWEARDPVRAQIVQRVTNRTGLRPAQGESLDDFLEAVARQARDTARLR
jgi:uncharacterized RDD family membrane protein YckC